MSMHEQGKSRQLPLTLPGIIFGVLAVCLVVFGVVMVYSSSSIIALTSQDAGHNAGYYGLRQAIFGLGGLCCAALLCWLDYRLLMKRGVLLAGAVLIVVLLACVLWSPWSVNINGSTRWIRLGTGMNLQPSEFAKPLAALCSASVATELARRNWRISRWDIALLTVCLVLPVFLILKEPDKGSALLIVVALIAALFYAGVPLRFMAVLVAVGFVGLVIIMMRDSYSSGRTSVVADPWVDPQGKGFQLIQALYAFAAGGIRGVGLGMSRQKYWYLMKEVHNDFIFSVIGEELGFVGTTAFLLVFALLVAMGYIVALQARDLKGKILASVSASMLGIQLLMNVAGELVIIPLSGKPIPFVSYGASAMLASCILAGMVLSVSHAATYDEKESVRVRPGANDEQRSRLRVIEGGVAERQRQRMERRARTERDDTRSPRMRMR